MKVLAFALLLLLAGCAHLPTLQPVDAARQARLANRCRSIFPDGRWQLVHTIHARFRNGRQAAMTGVILLSSADASIHCVLLSLEGFVFFDAQDDGELIINRAVGPFDSPDVARGVLRDIRLMFVAPDGDRAACGRFDGDAHGCRYDSDPNRIIDVFGGGDGRWHIRQHTPPRTIIAEAVDPRGIASRLTLDAHGDATYSLTLQLIEAVPLTEKEEP